MFVHGLTLYNKVYWLSSSTPPEAWPLWLKDDLHNVAIWQVRYDAAHSNWKGAAMALPDRGENVLAALGAERRLQTGNISFVTHSFGGLVVKQVLRSMQRKASQDASIANLLRHTRRVAFLGTPHAGADLATWSGKFRLIFRPSESAALERNDPNLRDLNLWYRGYSPQKRNWISGFGRESQDWNTWTHCQA